VTAWSTWTQRASARELATEQHKHERALASGARLFDKRSAVYESLVSFLQNWMRLVEANLPVHPSSVPDLEDEEEWRVMRVRLRTFGSAAVADAYDDFTKELSDFFFLLGLFLAMVEQQGPHTRPGGRARESPTRGCTQPRAGSASGARASRERRAGVALSHR
jgi:hypothetical protein